MKPLYFVQSRYLVLLLSLVLIGQSLLFQVRRIAQPSVGAVHVAMVNVATDEGISITTLLERPGGLRDGDLVLAIDDVDIEAWMANAFAPTISGAPLRVGESIAFTVRRGASTMTVQQALESFPLQRALAAQLPYEIPFHAFLLVAIFLFVKRPDERAAQVLLLIAVAQLTTNWGWGFQLTDLVSGAGFVHYVLSTTVVFTLIWIGFLHFALSFPRPQRWQVRRPWLVPAIYLVPFALIILWWLISSRLQGSVLGWFGSRLAPVFVILPLYLLLTFVVVAIKAGREDDPVRRAQIRWVLLAVTVAWLLAVLIQVGRYLATGNLQGGASLFPFIAAAFVLVPIAVVVAILRYRLFDIDFIIRRTLLYAILTAVLGLVYFGTVTVLTSLFSQATDQQSALAIVMSTLLIAALFTPLRRRIQDWIDRRFFRKKYDAQQVLARFALTARDETDLDALTTELVRVVQETMQPEQVSVWLRPTKSPKGEGTLRV